MKVALLLLLGIVMLSQNIKAEEQRDIDFNLLIDDDQLTPDEIQELLDLDDDDVLEFFDTFDEDGDGVLVEAEFDAFLAVLQNLDDDDDN